jgi:cyclic pyranopterin phosphate synthase
VRVGDEAILEITQHGKICHDRCAIYYQVGDCVMPRESVFARVIKGGQVKVGDAIETVEVTDQR